MDTLFLLLMFGSVISLMIGLIKPSIFEKLFKSIPTRKKLAGIFGGATIFFFIAFGITTPPVEPTEENATNITQQEAAVETPEPNKITESEEVIDDTSEAPTQVNNSLQTSDANELVNSQKSQQENTENQVQPVESNNEQFYSVTSVVDGDTVKVNINGTTETLRLIGIDTPETVHPSKPVECFGNEASNKAKELLSNKQVRLESDVSQGERDVYGRLLSYVFLPDGTNFNQLMIQEGYAYEYTYNIPYKYQSAFKQAQTDAQNNKRGLWADGVCDEYEDEPVAVEPEETTPPPTEPASDGYKWYVSSHHSSKQYYCETDDGWRGLSESYLKEYTSEAALLADFPNHTLNEPCK
ncbi:MAG: thermonuclease family protein [Patescibacteria group bacterium]